MFLLCCVLSCYVLRQRVLLLLWLSSCTCHASALCSTVGVTGKLGKPGIATSLPLDALAAWLLDPCI